MDKSRRQFLKFIAASPLSITFGFAGISLMRFIKPTMKPFGVFDPSDQPTCAEKALFQSADFLQPWTCIPFMYYIKYTEFNPELAEIRTIPAFILRLGTDEIVAYSRICPARGCGYLNFVPEPAKYNCGCGTKDKRCCCAPSVNNPVLMCPCDGSTFDLAADGRVIQGPAPRPPRRFVIGRHLDEIAVIGFEPGGIA